MSMSVFSLDEELSLSRVGGLAFIRRDRGALANARGGFRV